MKRTVKERLLEKVVRNNNGCWLFVGYTDNVGYGIIAYNGAKKAHRVSWEVFNGPIPIGMNVLHKCDVRHCVNPNHLFLGTQGDNADDMIAKGRKVILFGENHGCVKLTESQVVEIRRLANEGLSNAEIARRFNITGSNVYRIKKRKIWRHV